MMLKKYLMYIVYTVGAVVLSVIIGVCALMAVYKINVEPINQNIRESVDVFEKEGVYPNIHTLTGMRKLDNFTDSIMLSVAGYDGDESSINKTVQSYQNRIQDEESVSSLVRIYKNGEKGEGIPYSRYWHGYLITLKPALLIFNYQQIRTINTIFVMIALMAVCFLLYKKNMKKYILPYLFSILLISIVSISYSMQYSTIYYIFSVALIVLLLFESISKSRIYTQIYFIIIGCATSYFDLLTYPLATLAIPMTFYLCMNPKDTLVKTIKQMTYIVLSWGIGYAAMWAAKWGLVYCISDTENAQMSFVKILEHTSTRRIDYNIPIVETTIRCLRRFLINPMMIPVLIYVIVQLKTCMVLKPQKEDIIKAIPYMLISVSPIIWFEIVMRHHSYVHFGYVYREFVITALSLMCMMQSYIIRKRQETIDEKISL